MICNSYNIIFIHIVKIYLSNCEVLLFLIYTQINYLFIYTCIIIAKAAGIYFLLFLTFLKFTICPEAGIINSLNKFTFYLADNFENTNSKYLKYNTISV